MQTNQKALNESVATVEQAEELASDPEGDFNLASLLFPRMDRLVFAFYVCPMV